MATPGNPSQMTLAQKIDALRARFVQEWKAGRQPRIEDYINKASGSARSALLSTLLRAELDLLGQQGTVPSADTYRARFPGDAAVVTEVFSQATLDTRGAKVNETLTHHGAPAASTQGSTTKKLGRFELQSVLGQGAMGKVFKAYDPQLNRDVAIKVPIREAFRNDEERDRFLREARAAGSIQHPNICPIYDVGQEGTYHFIVMALIDGKPLSAMLEERRTLMPSRQVALLIRKLALTLQAAHEKGVVHRDLKPGNIMLDRQRKDLVIMDFGLARCASKDEARMTTEGAIMGTPAYMAPEQARGELALIGPACDIYALGVILYEMLTRRLPFTGSALAVISQVINQSPPTPSSVQPGVDPELEKICLRAMAKQPGERFASMSAFADALGAYLEKRPVDVPASAVETTPVGTGEATATTKMLEEIVARLEELPGKSHRGRWLIAAGLLGIAVAILVVALVLMNRDSGGPAVQVQIGGLTYINDNSVKFYLDGKEVSAEQLRGKVALRVGNHRIEIKRDDKVIEVREFKVAQEDTDRVILVKANDPPDTDVGEVATYTGFPDEVGGVVYLADGQHFLASEFRGAAVSLWDLKKANAVRKWLLQDGKDGRLASHYTCPRSLTISPDGQRLAGGWSYTVHENPGISYSALVLHDWETGKELHRCKFTSEDGAVYEVAFSPSGTLVLGSGFKSSVTRIFEVRTGEEVGRLEGKLSCFSPDSKSVLSVDSTGNKLWLWDLQQQPYRRQKEPFTGAKGEIHWVTFTPDGKQVVGADSDGSIRFWDVESRTEKKVLRSDPVAGVGHVCFSDDGDRLLSGHADGTVRYWDVESEKMLAKFEHGKGNIQMVSLSPGGRRALSCGPDRTVRWWQLPK